MTICTGLKELARADEQGVGVSSGALSNDIYTTVIIMVALTTIITPVWLKVAYRKDPPEPSKGANEIAA